MNLKQESKTKVKTDLLGTQEMMLPKQSNLK